ncbi:MAG TPA: hypothetical protein VMM13_20200 [Euzebya sp.]|nr:hypothetical protein [Euzebya sp.]
MEDPLEGVDGRGYVVTGVATAHVEAAHRPLISACVMALDDILGADLHSLRLNGSVATGQAVPGRSDLDLMAILRHAKAIDLTAVATQAVGPQSLVRDIGVSVITLAELMAPGAAARVERCFVHHYSVGVHGPDLALDEVPCKADAALAHGFSAGLLRRLPTLAAGDLGDVDDAPALGRAVLMSTALLLSRREGSWSTDRRRAIDLVGRHAPHHGADAEAVFDWADSRGRGFGSDSA